MNNTAFFHTCVELCGGKKTPSALTRASCIDPNLLRVATTIMGSVTTLERYVGEIQQEYLLTASKVLSEGRKRAIEGEIRMELAKLGQQIAHFERLVGKRDQTDEGASLIRNLVTFGEYGDHQSMVVATQTELFANVVRILQLRLKRVLDRWMAVYEKRQQRLRELGKLKADAVPVGGYEMAPLGPTQEFEEMEMGLDSHEQIQLQEEQQVLAETLKRTTLNQVAQIETSMMDISSMVRDINLQLSAQNEVIRELDANQFETAANVQLGNKDLVKATSKTRATNGTIFWGIVGASVFLLFIDWLL